MIQGITRGPSRVPGWPLVAGFPRSRRQLSPSVGLTNKVSDEDEPGYCRARQSYLQPPPSPLTGAFLGLVARGGRPVECLIVRHLLRVPRSLTRVEG